MVELCVITLSCFLLRNSNKNNHPQENRTQTFPVSGFRGHQSPVIVHVCLGDIYLLVIDTRQKGRTGHVQDRMSLFKSTDRSIFMQLLLPPQNLRCRHQLFASCTTPLRLRCNVLCCIVPNRNVLYLTTFYCTVPCCSRNNKSKHMFPSQGFDWGF